MGEHHEHEAEVAARDGLADEHVGPVRVDAAAFVEEVFDGVVGGEDDHGFGAEDEGVDGANVACKHPHQQQSQGLARIAVPIFGIGGVAVWWASESVNDVLEV